MRKMKAAIIVTGLGLMMCMSGCAKNNTVKTESTTQQIVDYVETTAVETEETVEETVETVEDTESVETEAVETEAVETGEVETEEVETGETDVEVENTEEKESPAEVAEETNPLEIEDGLLLPGEESWIEVGGVERQYENFKATMPEGYKYMGFHSGISSFSKEDGDNLLTTLVWYQSTGTDDSVADFSTMGAAELTIMADTMGKSLVEQIGDKVSDINTSIETINGSNYVAVTFKNNEALGYFVFTLSNGNLQGVITVTDITKEVAESTSLEVLNSVEFNGQICEQELNIPFTNNALEIIK